MFNLSAFSCNPSDKKRMTGLVQPCLEATLLLRWRSLEKDEDLLGDWVDQIVQSINGDSDSDMKNFLYLANSPTFVVWMKIPMYWESQRSSLTNG